MCTREHSPLKDVLERENYVELLTQVCCLHSLLPKAVVVGDASYISQVNVYGRQQQW